MRKTAKYAQRDHSFAAVEHLEDNEYITRARNAIRKNIKCWARESIGHCETKHHEP
jgi:hypothetical protein